MKWDWVKVGLWLVELLRKLFYAAGIAKGRIELSREQKEKADAVLADYDAITRDDRDYQSALERLHARGRNGAAPGPDGGE